MSFVTRVMYGNKLGAKVRAVSTQQQLSGAKQVQLKSGTFVPPHILPRSKPGK